MWLLQCTGLPNFIFVLSMSLLCYIAVSIDVLTVYGDFTTVYVVTFMRFQTCLSPHCMPSHYVLKARSYFQLKYFLN
jgi:hypothetical protein